jgi:hypothetical protein
VFVNGRVSRAREKNKNETKRNFSVACGREEKTSSLCFLFFFHHAKGNRAPPFFDCLVVFVINEKETKDILCVGKTFLPSLFITKSFFCARAFLLQKKLCFNIAKFWL